MAQPIRPTSIQDAKARQSDVEELIRWAKINGYHFADQAADSYASLLGLTWEPVSRGQYPDTIKFSGQSTIEKLLARATRSC